jgi:hypothetical protein
MSSSSLCPRAHCVMCCRCAAAAEDTTARWLRAGCQLLLSFMLVNHCRMSVTALQLMECF